METEDALKRWNEDRNREDPYVPPGGYPLCPALDSFARRSLVHCGKSGGSFHCGVRLIARFEFDDLVSKWASESTRLRVDLRTDVTNISVEGLLEVAAPGLMRVRLVDAGFIEFSLDDSWSFDYFDPVVTGFPLENRLGKDHAGDAWVGGAGIVGWIKPNHQLYVLEIAQQLPEQS